jgi:uncharacterized protein YjdB
MKKVSKALAVLVLILSISMVVPATQIPYLGTVDVQAAQQQLNVTKSTLIKGNTLTLKLGTIKSNKITWTSSNNVVAIVKKGVVTAQKQAGKATITAKYKNKKYTCKVTVETPSISSSSTSINIGKTAKIKVNGTSQAIQWSSSNNKVATVNSSGKVKGISAGTAKITAKIGSNKYKCTVKVSYADDPEDNDNKPKVSISSVSSATGTLSNVVLNIKNSDNREIIVSNSLKFYGFQEAYIDGYYSSYLSSLSLINQPLIFGDTNTATSIPSNETKTINYAGGLYSCNVNGSEYFQFMFTVDGVGYLYEFYPATNSGHFVW